MAKANSKEQFDWHITQAIYHVNSAINMFFNSHQINLSQLDEESLKEVQERLESVETQSRT